LQSFEQLVQRVADGGKVSEAEAEQVLDAAGKSAEDLAAAVNAILRRRAWVRQVADGEAAVAEAEKAVGQIVAADGALEQAIAAAHETHYHTVGPLRERLQILGGAERVGAAAKGELLRTASDASRAAVAAASLTWRQLSGRAGQIQGQIREGREKLADLRERIIRTKADNDYAKKSMHGMPAVKDVAADEAAAAALDAELTGLQGQLDDLAGPIAEARRLQEQAEAALLTP